MKSLRSVILLALIAVMVIITLPLSAIHAANPSPAASATQVVVKFTPGQFELLPAVFHPWQHYFTNPTYTFQGPTKDAPNGLVSVTTVITLPNKVTHSHTTGAQLAATMAPTEAALVPAPTTLSFTVNMTFKPSLKFGLLTWALVDVTVNGQQPASQQERLIRSLARYGLLAAWARSLRGGYYSALRGYHMVDVEITPDLLTITAQGRVRKSSAVKLMATAAATSAQ